MTKIAALMMLKNEEKRIHVTLNSIIGIMDYLIVYDTGSTDRTVEILEEFSKKHNIKLFIKHGEFVDFSTSRNVSLDFADEVSEEHGIDFLMLFDCNDELRKGNVLKKICKHILHQKDTAWLIQQEWFHGASTKYYNVRLIRPMFGWRYVGAVHEYITNDKSEIARVKLDDVVLYQDRTSDDDKSAKRFHRDEKILLKEFEKDPTNPRTTFYLAQTYACLGRELDAYKYYKIRTTQKGFYEEIFVSWLKIGDIAKKFTENNEKYPNNKIHHPDDTEEITLLRSFDWGVALFNYMKACEVMDRVEPFIGIARYYEKRNIWHMCYKFCKMALEIPFPKMCNLFVEESMYSRVRYELFCKSCLHTGRFQEGYDMSKRFDFLSSYVKLFEEKLNIKNTNTLLRDKIKSMKNNRKGKKGRRK
jgi:glycosyltransferase involved in cell wall biosynthesis